ncbi:cell division protein ZapA [Philodulcilactobacillus myokoensis]|uniref:Cell division protein ZapA n=1 Tax=Philodulcilactobacillus myokoensis TaxID=2929573 RepID=A0A9W6ES25_9LACO|nr:cell division protein ZapA [Philodulcilactobacillus myokoensis]GLB46686.1 cell division protein ZapA [Philodulcilactobacillus myokoensis]
MPKQRFKVTIDGHDYNLVGNSSSEHIKTVTELLNQQIKQIKQISPKLDDQTISVLLAFNAISDQLKLQAKLDRSNQY